MLHLLNHMGPDVSLPIFSTCLNNDQQYKDFVRSSAIAFKDLDKAWNVKRLTNSGQR